MSTNEEYLDSLLKSLASEEQENSEADDVLAVSENSTDNNESDSVSDLEDLLASLDDLDNLNSSNDLDNHNDLDNRNNIDNSDDLQETEELYDNEMIDFMDDNRDVTELLDTVEGDDELAEINALLKKSDNNELVDDDMLALLESVSDEEGTTSSDTSGDFDIFAMESMEEFKSEEDNLSTINDANDYGDIEALLSTETEVKGKKKKEKKVKKTKDVLENKEEIDELDFLNGEPPIKQGFFRRIFGALLDETEEITETVQEEILEDDNMAILKVMEAEDNAADKKGKKKRKGKDKEKNKEKNAKLSDDEDEIDNKKVKTKKKEKKLKLVKPEEPSKKISIKKIVPIFIICFTFMATIIILSMTIPNMIELTSARNAYYHKDYKTAYEKLSGKELNKSDNIMFQKASLVLQLERKWNSYENYMIMDKKLEALNALLQGVSRYNQLLILAEEYSVVNEFTEIYNNILNELKDTYQLTEVDVNTIIAYEDPITYSKVLESIIAGKGFNISLDSASTEMVNNHNTDNLQDVLVQEEDMINELNNTDDVTNGANNDLAAEQTISQNIVDGDNELFNGEVQGNNGSIIVPKDISQ